MRKANKVKNYSIIIFLIFIIVYSVFGIDYSGIDKISLVAIKSVLVGLFHPDWQFIYDGSGEDLISLLFLTICIAFLGTLIATFLALPLTLLGARTLWKTHPWIAKTGKFICNVLRAFPELVYAIIFVKVVGPGPFAGVLAIGIHQIGMLGKLYIEELEAMNEEVIESMDAVGAGFWQTTFFARVPELAPTCFSLALNHFEIAVRSAATLGLVGAGGIGAPMIFAIQARSWNKVGIILLGIIFTVFVIDTATGYLRKKLQ
ncbi:phosphonate ABC transporter, permease protein PhnE [Melissococcus plutonius]|uniref:Phosphonate ABC transporter permease protein phnE1 n=1 Tax=Melissococcus plutonius TaxID=33970 RepID=A0A2Z5Y144_9ENTE|nr:phosphonate ABC transporter, permease protein PhnE [Melissococcus plutonius]BAL61659.1 phosphonate ABC transporter permease PhnE1 [Melissococcus plutonius DAT561]MCV2498396.1 phosphonate ABC transporter, permease protein PhnE [Melissococcus plutonius]MCV2500389.1 phosphonate ABC transporter, permease protein PhnE [Melissococcus plutonius]MCV2504493.1 phosphonate ABC transporter, permease protein PhnE [Melissococcus plutonius]MCV2507011.1 phosphonate ABC transporter, permease protein PhnE [M